ncbi:MAG: molybdopterin-dependent oxidoreductase [Candidatus Geothermarchaeales archaeon]
MGSLTRRRFLEVSAGAGAALLLASQFSEEVFELFPSPLLTEATAEATLESGSRLVPTTCWIGKQECGMLARLVDGRVVKLEGHPDHPRNRGTLCPKGQSQIMAFYDPYRLKAPLKRTNEKGVPGEWVEVSWDEALTTVGEKVREVMDRDPRLLIWQKGRSKAKKFYDSAFVKAVGATKLGHGAYCSDAAYRAEEYTVGLHGGLHPDFRHCGYLLSWGWNMVNAGGNKLCWITWPQQFLEARERGMKVVTLDPWRRGMGPHTDEWLPIKPGTDLALFLALANVLVARGYMDIEYLTSHTNSPFLVKEDGYFLRSEGKEQVWDTVSNSAKPFDAEGISPALEGEYTVDGERVKTAFQVFKDRIAQYSPTWAASECDLPASTIRRIAEELGENALIGSRIVLEGVEIPYRPVGIMAYHVSQQEPGFQAFRAATIVFMLLGAIEAVGGLRVDFSRKIHKNFAKLDSIEVKDPPYNIYLKDSKFFPINTGNPGIMALAMLDPVKYEVDYTPEVAILHMCNPILSFVDQEVLFESYRKFKFVAVIDAWMSETADYFADIVLPAATIEKYEGPINVTDQYHDATSLRLPPMDPLFKTKGDIDIYIDLCEEIGVLYGEGGYIDRINSELKLSEEYALDLNTKPAVRDIFDRWARSSGYENGIEHFEENGISEVKPIPANKLYAPAWDPPYGGIRHRLYGESLNRYQDAMREKGAAQIFWQDYTALPIWRQLTMDKSPSDYDLYLISHKKIEYKQSRATFIPQLNELEPEQRIEMNPSAARAKGIAEGDEVWVESHNAVTQETRRVKAKVEYVEGIRPDTVSMAHHYGFWVHPKGRGGGPTPNSLFFTGEGYVLMTADQSFHVKVKVYKETD